MSAAFASRVPQPYLAVTVVAACAGQARSNTVSPFCASPQLVANWIVATMTKATIVAANTDPRSHRRIARSAAYIVMVQPLSHCIGCAAPPVGDERGAAADQPSPDLGGPITRI